MITDHDLPLFFKLGDFGFSVELDSPRHPSNFLGTVPYTAPVKLAFEHSLISLLTRYERK